MQAASVWAKACSFLREDMNEVSYSTWIDPALKPITLQEDCLFLEANSDFTKKQVAGRYAQLISNAISHAAGQPLRAEVLTAMEAQARFPSDMGNQLPQIPYALNPKYTFHSFVVGNSNRFAHAAAVAVSEAPAEAYNPLFIYGGVGLGKTHLMHAIGHHIRELYPEMRLLYISSESFTNELILAIQQNRNVDFRARFRNVDVLMVDDIQFIAGRDTSQEEFFNTFNALHAAGKQVIISSDRPPKEIMRLEERLVSRFEWGLVADIQKPDFETRTAILFNKAKRETAVFPQDVLEFIASRIDTNIRELEGSLTRVAAYSTLTGRAITQSLAEEALKDVLALKDPKRINCQAIQEAVAHFYSIDIADLTAKRRSRDYAVPRQVAMYLTREMTDLSLTQIGTAFARDHSTVMHACDRVAGDTSLKLLLDDLRGIIRNA